MKNRGFSLLQLLLAMVVLSVAGAFAATLIHRFGDVRASASMAKAYVTDLEIAIDAYTAQQMQDCVSFSSLSIEDLRTSGFIQTDSHEFPTEIEIETATDAKGRVYPRLAILKLTFSEEENAKYSLAQFPHSSYEKKGKQYIVSVRHRIGALAHSSRDNDYIKQQLPMHINDDYCFDRTLLGHEPDKT